MQKIKSNWLDLCALIFLIHFFGALHYAIFISVFSMRQAEPPQLLTGLELHSWIGLVSATIALCTAVAERVHHKYLAMVVAKWSFRVWLVALGLTITWLLAFPG